MLTGTRKLLKTPLVSLLGWPVFRRRAIFELQQRYYAELSTAVPLGHGLQCPVLFREAWHSFSETFVHGEYARPFNQLPLPGRWLDIGCHAGFFSLYVAWRRAEAGRGDLGAALLLDADSRMATPVGELLRVNGMTEHFQFLHGMVARGEGHRAFRERSVMASSAAGIGGSDGRQTSVPVITATEIVARFPPPYDLVKVDIEGGEYDFIREYDPVLNAANAILIEWHLWHPGGGGPAQLREDLRSRGFLEQILGDFDPQNVARQETGLMLLAKSRTGTPIA